MRLTVSSPISHPVPHYLVVGETHPRVLERDGERYRNGLHVLAPRAARRSSDMITFHAPATSTSPPLCSLAARRRCRRASHMTRTSRWPRASSSRRSRLGEPVIATAFAHAIEFLVVPALACSSPQRRPRRGMRRGDPSGPVLNRSAGQPRLTSRAARPRSRAALAGGGRTRYRRRSPHDLMSRRDRGEAKSHEAFQPHPSTHILRLTDDHRACSSTPRVPCPVGTGSATASTTWPEALVVAARQPRSHAGAGRCHRAGYLDFIVHAQAPDGRFHNRMGTDAPRRGRTSQPRWPTGGDGRCGGSARAAACPRVTSPSANVAAGDRFNQPHTGACPISPVDGLRRARRSRDSSPGHS